MTTLTHALSPHRQLFEALQRSKLIVCCGAGGVGKTTTSAALALAGARLGKRVLALTIDPSKRLAQTLGVSRNTPEPVLIERSRLDALGVPKEGQLFAWLLDPKLISDKVVNEEAGEEAEELKQNLIYQQISGIVAGMQEYTAVEALHQFLNEERFDLIILDTPPSRHALRFIDSPQRVAAFLDKRIFRLFVPNQSSIMGKVASKLIDEVLDRAFGEQTRHELKQFFELFSRLLDHLHQNQEEMSVVFKSPDVIFYMVTTARIDAIDEAQRFAKEVLDRELNLGGFFINRTPQYSETLSVDESLTYFSEAINSVGGSHEQSERLGAVLKPLLLSEEKASALRRSTSSLLDAMGSVIALSELRREASSLEGISSLADEMLGHVSSAHEDLNKEDPLSSKTELRSRPNNDLPDGQEVLS